MACRKCGSDWKTRWGKDKLSCPECCKQQRCVARRLGKIPATAAKTCERCGVGFEAANAAEVSRSRHCQDCRGAARKEWLANWRAKVASGETVPAAQKKTQTINCGWCNAETRSKNRSKYCSRDCFMAARKAGVQSWDRTRQEAALLSRICVCGSPSQDVISTIRVGFAGFMVRLRKLQRLMLRPPCAKCGEHSTRTYSSYCSKECARTHLHQAQCKTCQATFIAMGRCGRPHTRCDDCRKVAERKSARAARRRYGKNHRERARHHGVKYVRFRLQDIYERDEYTCQICRKRVYKKARYRKSDGKIHPRSPSIDHIVAMARGGNHEPHNCQTACFICNSRKGASVGGQLRLSLEPTPAM